MNKIKTINFNEYTNQFKIISNKINKDLLFKVDQITTDNKFNIYYNIPNRSLLCISLINYNTIEIKSLISIGFGYGSEIVQYIIKKYNKRFNIILDSFESNNKFYLKNKFKPYKKDAYNPLYDPLNLNKNKEPVIYYKIKKGDAI